MPAGRKPWRPRRTGHESTRDAFISAGHYILDRARQLMGYGGIVASEHSSGESSWRGGITKTGNAHLRRVVVEAAWAYRHQPAVGSTLRHRQARSSPEVIEIAWKAQQRLHRRYGRLIARGKSQQTTITAVARELMGFIW